MIEKLSSHYRIIALSHYAGSLSKLQSISLYSNSLNGTIPSTLGNLFVCTSIFVTCFDIVRSSIRFKLRAHLTDQFTTQAH